MTTRLVIKEERREMRELRDIILGLLYSEPPTSQDELDKAILGSEKEILAIFPSLSGIKVVKECDYCNKPPRTEEIVMNGKRAVRLLDDFTMECPNCHGTGEISRDAEWGDIDIVGILREVSFYEYEDDALLTTKSGGRLVVRG